MIPILYPAGETSFTTNGLGRLSDATYCVVKEERNGEYELEMEYPITGIHYSDIQEDRIIYAKPADAANPQPFRIYKTSKPISGIITINAEHISYLLNKIPVMPFTAESCVSAMSQLSARAAFQNPFTFWTDKSVSASYTLKEPTSIRSILGGEENSLLSVYGKGEYEFDKFEVKLHLNRGQDRGVTLRYGKNITDLTNEVDLSNVYTGIVPFWKGTVNEQEMVLTIPDGVVWANGHADDYGSRLAKVVDFSSEWDEMPTVEQLTQRSTKYLNDNEGWKPPQNIKVTPVALWLSDEYKDTAVFERIHLCDTVTVVYPQLGVNVKMKVITVEYDVLTEKVKEFELGEASSNLSKTIDDSIDSRTKGLATKNDLDNQTTYLEREVKRATDMITGGLGGYVVFKYNADDQPEEILIMDNLDMEQAVNVIRMNRNGIGFSTSGYEGPFTTAWTIDGHFNADFITTGNILASLITSGTIRSHNGTVYFDLDGDEIVASRLSVPRVSSVSNSHPVRIDLDALAAGAYLYNPDRETKGDGLYITSDGLHHANGGIHLTSEGYTSIGGEQTSIGAAKESGSTHNYAELTFYAQAKAGSQFTHSGWADFSGYFQAAEIYVNGPFGASGTKSRIADTDNYNRRLLYCYEMPSPMFGDIGEGVTDEHGLAYISIDDIFDETIRSDMEYQVFLQPEGRGELWVQDKTPNYFTVCGDANLKFSWELKAKQRGYEYERLEDYDNQVAERDQNEEPDLMLLDDISKYLEEQEDLAYETAE